jgi:hypothetical protein
MQKSRGTCPAFLLNGNKHYTDRCPGISTAFYGILFVNLLLMNARGEGSVPGIVEKSEKPSFSNNNL